MNITTHPYRNLMSIEINKPYKGCPDQCENAKTALLWIANNLNKEIDVTQIIIVCNNCQKSYWKIMERK